MAYPQNFGEVLGGSLKRLSEQLIPYQQMVRQNRRQETQDEQNRRLFQESLANSLFNRDMAEKNYALNQDKFKALKEQQDYENFVSKMMPMIQWQQNAPQRNLQMALTQSQIDANKALTKKRQNPPAETPTFNEMWRIWNEQQNATKTRLANDIMQSMMQYDSGWFNKNAKISNDPIALGNMMSQMPKKDKDGLGTGDWTVDTWSRENLGYSPAAKNDTLTALSQTPLFGMMFNPYSTARDVPLQPSRPNRTGTEQRDPIVQSLIREFGQDEWDNAPPEIRQKAIARKKAELGQ